MPGARKTVAAERKNGAPVAMLCLPQGILVYGISAAGVLASRHGSLLLHRMLSPHVEI